MDRLLKNKNRQGLFYKKNVRKLSKKSMDFQKNMEYNKSNKNKL